MLLKRQMFKPARPALNMGAMIDVVFLLLIFFMCTTSFQSLESGLSVQLPRLSSESTRQEEYDPIWIRLFMTEDRFRITCDSQACANFAKLKDMLSARRSIADIPVIIEGQDTIPFRYMVTALDTCYEVGLNRVAFSAQGAGL